MSFVRLDEAVAFLFGECGIRSETVHIESLINASILPVFALEGQPMVLRDDLLSLRHVLAELAVSEDTTYLRPTLFSPPVPTTLTVSGHTQGELVHPEGGVEPAFFAAIRNLAVFADHIQPDTSLSEPVMIPYFAGTQVTTSSGPLRSFVDRQLRRARAVETLAASQFAGTAHYMGCKRSLAGFLLEAAASTLPDRGVVLDVMCGSGAAAAAFNTQWETVVSDAQAFCRLLALVQGGGYTANQAEKTLDFVLPIAREHATELRNRLEGIVEWEDHLFHGDVGEDLLAGYREFAARVPTYPDGVRYKSWDPVAEVAARRCSPQTTPYCLFTCYFANVYFGVRQCVEIDSLRFAIDQLKSERDREWALGALIAAISDRGTTYGGHFAQPKSLSKYLKHDSSSRRTTQPGASAGMLGVDLQSGPAVGKTARIPRKGREQILEKRASSIMHEFSIRLSNLAEQSESSPRAIGATPGPWRAALHTWRKRLGDRAALVYLDAPYKREEYSRYYHVLETLVAYNYPSAVGTGKVPDKRTGERFQSEFATRSRVRLEASLAEVILESLEYGWSCAWSYSDSGDASIPGVVSQVTSRKPVRVTSYSAPYEHKPLGGRSAKRVREYLIIFQPPDDV